MSLNVQGTAAPAAAAELARQALHAEERRQSDRRDPLAPDRRRSAQPQLCPSVDRRQPTAVDRRAQQRRLHAAPHLALDAHIEWLVHSTDLASSVHAEPGLTQSLHTQIDHTLSAALHHDSEPAQLALHRALYLLYSQAFAHPLSAAARNQHHPLLMQATLRLETAWEAHLHARVHDGVEQALAGCPDFANALQHYCDQHRLRQHPLFDFLAHRAGQDQMRHFFLQDSAVVLRFYDLLVLAMVGAAEATRGELAVNLLDEMGNLQTQERHTNLFRRLLHYVGMDDASIDAHSQAFHRQADGPCLAGHNLYLLLGLRRRNYFRSLGCLGSAELMDSAQYLKIVQGCHRLGWTDTHRLAYYSIHAEVDVAHGQGWLEQVMLPMVQQHPGAAREFMLGTAFRLETAAHYYDHLLARFQQR